MITYAARGADGQLHPLEADISGMVTTHKQRVDDAQESAWSMLPIGALADVEVQHRLAELAAYPDALLARWAITKTVTLDPVAEPEPPPRAQLPKSTVMGRVFALGFTAQAKALFDANFELSEKWRSPDWPDVYCDDPGLLWALGQMGLSAAQIAQVVAV